MSVPADARTRVAAEPFAFFGCVELRQVLDKTALDERELMEAARQRGTTTFHPNGTCRMAPRTDPLAVVDDQLRVHGLEGLRVVDASIMPTMLSANLNAGTMMLADKASDMIRGRAAPEPIVLAS